MTKEKPEISDATKKKMGGKTFTKNPINGTKFTIAISSATSGPMPNAMRVANNL